MEYFAQHRQTLFVHTTLFMINFVWGVFAVYSRWALQDYVPELVFSSMRFMMALPFMFMAAVLETMHWQVLIPTSWEQLGHFAVLGTLCGAGQGLYISGLARTSGMCVLICRCSPPGLLYCRMQPIVVQ
jgi:drug/metabolite transporter (DMT)-like permease